MTATDGPPGSPSAPPPDGPDASGASEGSEGSDEKTRKRENTGGLVALLTVLGVGALLALGYVGLHALAGDKVPRGTSVAGVEIGDRSPAAAEDALREGLGEREGVPIAVTVGERTTDLDPADAGLTVDHAATVAEAGGGDSWAPSRLWNFFTGGGEVDPLVTVDEAALEKALQAVADEGERPTNGTVEFEGAEIVTTKAADGEGIDIETAAPLVADAYLDDDPAVTLEVTALEPKISDDDVQAALDDFANAAVSGPVTLRFDKTAVRIFPKDFTAALSMKPRSGSLEPVLDRKALTRIVDSRLAGDDGEPVDARLELVDGKPKVIPSKPGVTYEPKDVSSAFLGAVAAEPGEREVDVEATAQDAAFSTADARKLGVKEKVSTFTTNFPYAEYRNVNIGRAGELINNTLVKPGEEFSLNGIVGERTAENGFTTGFVISDGIFKEDLGGGVSQMATTSYNAGFFGGMTDVEHKPHSFYIDRYPEGREATVAWPTLDMRWRNDTPYGVLVQAVVEPSTPSTQGAATVTLWSTKYWDIDTKTSERYNFTSPGTRTLDTADCYPNTGYGGFDVDVWRYFKRTGTDKVVRTQKLHTTYIPSDTVVCEPPGSGDDD